MIQELAGILDTLRTQHEQLIELADAKKEAVMTNRLDKLSEVTTRESRLVKLIVETEQSRQRTTAEVLRRLGIKLGSGATVSNIAIYVTGADDKRRLTDAAQRLSETIDALKRKNDLNMTLVQTAKDFNDFSLDLLTGGNEPDYIFGNPTTASGGKPKTGQVRFEGMTDE